MVKFQLLRFYVCVLVHFQIRAWANGAELHLYHYFLMLIIRISAINKTEIMIQIGEYLPLFSKRLFRASLCLLVQYTIEKRPLSLIREFAANILNNLF